LPAGLPAAYQPPPRRAPDGAKAGTGRLGWVKTHLAWVGWASAGAALVVAGVILGAALTSSSSPVAGPPPPPKTACESVAKNGVTYVCMDRNRGYPDTAFSVEGGGFAPRTPLTIHVSEIDPANNQLFSQTSADRPFTGSDGTFKVSFGQLYQGTLQLGLVTVTVTGPGGEAFKTQFMVIPPGAPLSGGPPPG
jgi:hypothetical protein